MLTIIGNVGFPQTTVKHNKMKYACIAFQSTLLPCMVSENTSDLIKIFFSLCKSKLQLGTT